MSGFVVDVEIVRDFKEKDEVQEFKFVTKIEPVLYLNGQNENNTAVSIKTAKKGKMLRFKHWQHATKESCVIYSDSLLNWKSQHLLT